MVVALFATTQINSIDAAAKFLIKCGAGLGLVLILRWYWWRLNAWSEITASVSPFIAYYINYQFLKLEEPLDFLFIVSFCTISWILVTFLTKPTKNSTLSNFYTQVRPNGSWKPFQKAGDEKSAMLPLFVCWISSIIMVYSCLFFIGDLIFLNYKSASIEALIIVISFIILRFQLKKTRIFDN